jgi:hypothetical protein
MMKMLVIPNKIPIEIIFIEETEKNNAFFLTSKTFLEALPPLVGDFPYCDNPYIFALIELSEYPQSENSIAKKLIAGTTFWVYQTRITLFY